MGILVEEGKWDWGTLIKKIFPQFREPQDEVDAVRQNYGDFLKEKVFDPLEMHRTTKRSKGDDNVPKSHPVLDDRSPYHIPRPQIGEGTLLECAAGVKTTVNDLPRLYQGFLRATKSQFASDSTSTPGFPLKHCTTLFGGHNRLPGAYIKEQSYGFGWVRSQRAGPLRRLGVNPSVVDTMPTVCLGSRSRLCFYHQGNMPGSSTLIYSFPKTETAIIVLQNSLALNDFADWVGQAIVEAVFDVTEEMLGYLRAAQESANRYMYGSRS
ncbi:MAG: hypothetical protein M1830_002207 [Pleopsidium flavum]|nr:MAG: hypothetical protein M1830_002207 [Pleopsidium flavum]